MKKGFFDFFVELPPLAKTIIVIALIVAVIIIILWIRKSMRTKGQRQELQDITTQINILQSQGMQASYSSAQYSTWANQLQEAFDGCGTSNEVWRNIIMKLKNDLDVALLIDAYGVRTFDECNWEFNFGDFTGSLSEAFVHELSSSEIKEVNQLLQSNNVTYRF